MNIMIRKIRGLLIAIILGSSSIAYANQWQFTVAPYLWAMNMSGDVGVASLQTHIHENFSDILKQFHGGGMLWLDADKDRFGLFVNLLYAVLKQNTDYLNYTFHTENKFGLYTIGASYKVYDRKYSKSSRLSIQPYIGARITSNNTTVSITTPSLSAKSNHSWTDPIIGLRGDYNFNCNWQIILAGDVGGTNFNNHKSANFNGFIGYSPSSMQFFSAYLGYRWLDQHYATGTGIKYFLWNMHLFGPVLGIAFRF
jgi:hypothetical protein